MPMGPPPIPPPTPDAKPLPDTSLSEPSTTLPPSTVRRNPPRRARNQNPAAAAIPPFPVHELSGDPPKPHDRPAPENLRVFLRIRPLEPEPRPRPGDAAGDRAHRGRTARDAKPKQAASKKKKNEPCLVVSGTSSVTLVPPPSSLLDPKRAKSEVYDGFSHVFPPESTQNEVYEKVMSPLVRDFMGGKSGLLAAMGPTGSGKTYTMHGSLRNPGMVSLALQEIFSHGVEDSANQGRSYYFSMFEICCERGKGERIIDLSPSGTEAFLQQSTIRGLQEIVVSSAVDAECLIARGMLRRATSSTNANNQSSRSQCVINIRQARKISDGELDVVSNVVLTVIDLAGAERERKTSNQGAKLVESGFINNTSMFFGLCLRSLMEHQKNPKKQLQKHFQNSLLTRYLKDYLEGKKRFALILTAKQGNLDYPETSCLLRQASPYMQIKKMSSGITIITQECSLCAQHADECFVFDARFLGFEEVPNPPCRKRLGVHPRLESAKRRNCGPINDTLDDIGKQRGTIARVAQEVDQTSQQSENKQISSPAHSMVSSEEALPQEQHTELQGLKRSQQIMCSFSRALWNVLKQYKQKLEASESEVRALKESLIKESSCVSQLEKELQHLQLQSLSDENIFQEASSTPKDEKKSECHPALPPSSLSEEKMELEAGVGLDLAQQLKLESAIVSQNHIQNEDLKVADNLDVSINWMLLNGISADVCSASSKQSPELPAEFRCITSSSAVHKSSPDDKKSCSELHISVVSDGDNLEEGSIKKSSPKGVDIQASKPPKPQKPRRRLIPSSAMLLKEFGGVDVDIRSTKGSDVVEKEILDGRQRSQGSMILLHHLRSTAR